MNNLKAFEIRWGDLDPNRHVANTSFSAFFNETRMWFLAQEGFTQASFEKYEMGPIVVAEEFYYLKEVMPNEKVHTDIELLGNTENYKFIKFAHSLYNEAGKQAAYSEVLFTWLDLKARKIIIPPQEVLEILENMPKAPNYHVFSESDTRTNKIPKKNLNNGLVFAV